MGIHLIIPNFIFNSFRSVLNHKGQILQLFDDFEYEANYHQYKNQFIKTFIKNESLNLSETLVGFHKER